MTPNKQQAELPTDDDFERIKSALLDNPRGRWFLEEYLQRNRPEDTQKLLAAIQRIENNLDTQGKAGEEAINPIRMTVMEMSDAIAQTRQEIASIKPNEETDDQIITATEELGAIVEATEMATNTILEAAEDIQESAWILREAGADEQPCGVIDEKTTDIYTACSFQDITGQRTTKVVQALCFIENRLNAMIEIWGLDQGTNTVAAVETKPERPDAHLLNGPALGDDGLDQSDVDAVEFDQPLTREFSSNTEAADTPEPNAVDKGDVDTEPMQFDAIDTNEDALLEGPVSAIDQADETASPEDQNNPGSLTARLDGIETELTANTQFRNEAGEDAAGELDLTAALDGLDKATTSESIPEETSDPVQQIDEAALETDITEQPDIAEQMEPEQQVAETELAELETGELANEPAPEPDAALQDNPLLQESEYDALSTLAENPASNSESEPEGAMDFGDIAVNEIEPLSPLADQPAEIDDANTSAMDEAMQADNNQDQQESAAAAADTAPPVQQEASSKQVVSMEEAANEPDLQIDELSDDQTTVLLG